jgi:hypothetical protein
MNSTTGMAEVKGRPIKAFLYSEELSAILQQRKVSQDRKQWISQVLPQPDLLRLWAWVLIPWLIPLAWPDNK